MGLIQHTEITDFINSLANIHRVLGVHFVFAAAISVRK